MSPKLPDSFQAVIVRPSLYIVIEINAWSIYA